jgi:hypothetical protein
MFVGTCFRANVPEVIATANIFRPVSTGPETDRDAKRLTGSVGVRQADIHSAEMKLSPGKSPNMNPAEVTQPMAIVGTTMITRLFQWRARYAWGSSTPIAKSPVASVMRMTSRVIALESLLQERGLKMFAPWGPMIIPNAVAMTDSPIYSFVFVRRCEDIQTETYFFLGE